MGRRPAPDVDRDSVYAGIGGLPLVLAEIRQSRALSGAEQALAAGIAARLSATAPFRADPSLYTGLGGDVTALKLLAPGGEQVALARLAALMTPAGWNTPRRWGPARPCRERPGPGDCGGGPGRDLGGRGAARAIAAPAVRPCCGRPTYCGWPGLGDAAGLASRMPNYSHGTAGVAAALAIAGAELGRDDFIAAACGAQHLLAVGSLGMADSSSRAPCRTPA